MDTRQVVANPRLSAGSTAASYWLHFFLCTTETTPHADLKKLRPPLDIGSQINARPELLPEADARQERSNCLICQGGFVG